MRTITPLVLLLLAFAAISVVFATQSMPASGARYNDNDQVAAEIANAYRLPIQILPAILVPNLPALSVFFGQELIAADGLAHNGQSSFQIVADVLDMESTSKQLRTGLIHQDKVREEFAALKFAITTGGK